MTTAVTHHHVADGGVAVKGRPPAVEPVSSDAPVGKTGATDGFPSRLPADARRLLVVDDHAPMVKWLAGVLERVGYDVRTATRGDAAEALCQSWRPAMVIVDLVLPDRNGIDLMREVRTRQPETEFVVLTGHGSVPKAVEAMRAGAHNFVEKPVEPAHMLAVLRGALEHRALSLENRALRRELDRQFTFEGIHGKAPCMREILSLIQRVGPTDASVLIVGESGVGKELVANAVHGSSRRARGPFVKINCASFPKDLIESELFGYQKGAFTGATTNREGLLKAASGGSLLLDEIAEMPANLQAKLLRVLQTCEYRPVGSNQTQHVDFRLISATNVDIEAALRDGRLREDLYFRINTITVRVPPLRERAEDIPLLCQHFLERYRTRHRSNVTGIAPSAYEALLQHQWPGNVRELEHAIERAVLVAATEEIRLEDLPELMGSANHRDQAGAAELPNVTLEELERMALIQVLERTKGNKTEAAEQLGLYRQTLYAKIRKYGLEVRKTVEQVRS